MPIFSVSVRYAVRSRTAAARIAAGARATAAGRSTAGARATAAASSAAAVSVRARTVAVTGEIRRAAVAPGTRAWATSEATAAVITVSVTAFPCLAPTRADSGARARMQIAALCSSTFVPASAACNERHSAHQYCYDNVQLTHLATP